jgi:uncharacterized protein YciI
MTKKAVPAKEIMDLSRQHGMLAKQLYVVSMKPIDGLDPIFANMKEHLEFQIGLEKQGIMFAGGPVWTEDGQEWEGDGMVVIRAKSIEEARDIAARDPMYIRGARSFTVRPWMVNEGSVIVRLDYSTGRFHFD